MSYEEYRRLVAQGDFQGAAQYAEHQAASGHESREFWLTQQASALNSAGKHQEALAAGQSALAISPGSAFAVAATADALLGMRRFEEALGYYEEALEDPRLAGTARKGVFECLSGLKRWEALLERLAGGSIPEEQRLLWSAKALSALGRDEEALDACRRWLEIRPHHPAALWESTELEIRINGLEATLEKARRFARIPSLPQVYREIFASLCRRAGKPEEAMKAYETIGAEGEQGRIQKKKAFTLAKSGRESEALPMLEELLKREPADTYLNSSYMAACGRIDRLDRAFNFYNSLLTLHPGEKSIYGRIRRVKTKMGESG